MLIAVQTGMKNENSTQRHLVLAVSTTCVVDGAGGDGGGGDEGEEGAIEGGGTVEGGEGVGETRGETESRETTDQVQEEEGWVHTLCVCTVI